MQLRIYVNIESTVMKTFIKKDFHATKFQVETTSTLCKNT